MENAILFAIGVKIVFGFILGGVAVLIYNIARKRKVSQTESKAMAVFFSFFVYGFAVIETIFCFLYFVDTISNRNIKT